MTDNINRLKDKDNPTETEKKHVPVIEGPSMMTAGGTFEVKVSVGIEPHVMEEDHYIEWIDLYLADQKIGRMDLGPSAGKAEATFNVTPQEELIGATEFEVCHIRGVNVCGDCGLTSVITDFKAIESCNVHGLWESSMEVEVMSSKQKPGRKCSWKI
jgi:superoxide reductase